MAHSQAKAAARRRQQQWWPLLGLLGGVMIIQFFLITMVSDVDQPGVSNLDDSPFVQQDLGTTFIVPKKRRLRGKPLKGDSLINDLGAAVSSGAAGAAGTSTVKVTLMSVRLALMTPPTLTLPLQKKQLRE